MGNQPFDPSQPGGVPPQPGQLPGWSDPGSGWAPPGWGSQGAPGATPPGWGSQGAPGATPPGWGAPEPPSSWGGPGHPAWSGQYPPPGVRPGSRVGRVIAVLLGVMLVAAAVTIPVLLLTRQSPAAQAAALYKEAMQAGGKSAGFHYVETWNGDGEPATFSGQAGQSDGDQQVTQATDFGNEVFQIVLAPDQTAYIEGNAAALQDQMGVSASAAPGLSGTWISVQPKDAPYQNEVDTLTISSALPDGQLTPTSTEQISGSGGGSLTRIEGTVSDPSGTGHLDISPSTDLPVTLVASYDQDGSSYTETMSFTQWGQAPTLSVPVSAVAWSTLTASAPPDGYGSGETPGPAPTPSPTPSGVGSAA